MVLIKHVLMVHYLHGGPDQGLSVLLDFAVSISPQTETPPSLSSWVTPPPLFLLNMQSGWRSRSSASTPPTSTTSKPHLLLHLLLLLNTQSGGQLLEDADRSKLNRTSPSPANSLLIPFSRTAEFKTRHKTQENLRIKLGFYGSVLNIIIDIVICFIRWIFQYWD